MIEPGESGIEGRVLERFLGILSGLDGLDLFPERFTLEILSGGECHLLHVSRLRGVIRPVIPEDSRKKLLSMERSDFVSLVEGGDRAAWSEAFGSGIIRVK
jgi:hypothetical protein